MTGLRWRNLKTLGLLVLSFAAAAACIWTVNAALQTGEIARRAGRLVTALDDPARFWTYLLAVGLTGVGLGALGVALAWSLLVSRGEDRRIDRYLERRRRDRV